MADSGETYWVERAQSAEARLVTLKANYEPALDKIRNFKSNFGVREHADGTIDIDFEKMVKKLGAEACLDLRRIIDEIYNISGGAGEKPRMRVKAGV